MTHQEWLACEDPVAMLDWLTGPPDGPGRGWQAGCRKLRLFVAACVRQFWHLAADERVRRAVEVAERYADGEVPVEELDAAAGGELFRLDPVGPAELAVHCHLLRDVFGDPFRPVAPGHSCRSTLLAGLAAAAYEDRILPAGELDPVRLAVLADALEEAGAAPDFFLHLRGPGPHVRGCWVVDAILGKG